MVNENYKLLVNPAPNNIMTKLSIDVKSPNINSCYCKILHWEKHIIEECSSIKDLCVSAQVEKKRIIVGTVVHSQNGLLTQECALFKCIQSGALFNTSAPRSVDYALNSGKSVATPGRPGWNHIYLILYIYQTLCSYRRMIWISSILCHSIRIHVWFISLYNVQLSKIQHLEANK